MTPLREQDNWFCKYCSNRSQSSCTCNVPWYAATSNCMYYEEAELQLSNCMYYEEAVKQIMGSLVETI